MLAHGNYSLEQQQLRGHYQQEEQDDNQNGDNYGYNDHNYDGDDDGMLMDSTGSLISNDSADLSIPMTHLVEDTIDTMEETHLCIHPIHKHSFQQTHHLWLLQQHQQHCVGCRELLRPPSSFVSFFRSTSNGSSSSSPSAVQLVRCIACHQYAHRSCAFGRAEQFQWEECQVNTKKLNKKNNETSPPSLLQDDDDEGDGLMISPTSTLPSSHEKQQQQTAKLKSPPIRIPPATMLKKNTATTTSLAAAGDKPQNSHFFNQLLGFTAFTTNTTIEEVKTNSSTKGTVTKKETRSNNSNNNNTEEVDFSDIDDDDDDDDNNNDGKTPAASSSMVWTDTGPPQHWADKAMIKPTVQIDINTFASVARVVQDHVLFHFRRMATTETVTDGESESNGTVIVNTTSENDADNALSDDDAEGIIQTVDSETLSDSQVLLKKVKPTPAPDPPDSSSSTISKVVSGTYKTYQVVKKTSTVGARLQMASVAGGLVGGVAGLWLAGPAGAAMGVSVFQQSAVGVMSVILDVGVLIVGATAGTWTARQLEEQHQQRVLELGEEGVKQKLMLVRPQICIDPKWTEICAQAKRDAPVFQKSNGYLSVLTSSSPGKIKSNRDDKDIVQTDESELPTVEKVLLLVSRILNDKTSLPGHVYRELINEYKKRDNERRLERLEQLDLGGFDLVNNDDDGVSPLEQDSDRRQGRQDVHAVIKHVTATLLEVRPGFGASPAITEMAATAVESLVFGELYKSVFAESLEETRQVDKVLIEKIMSFDQKHPSGPDWDQISTRGLATLAKVPQAETPVDKLRYFVEFLEHVSDHYSERMKNSSKNGAVLGADSLLKMVCQHLLVAKVPYLNAELTFLEEFARDERLLRGKEGYALVTLQASLHFLNASSDFDQDILMAAD